MQKLLMIILPALLFLSLVLGAIFLFSFTQKGNAVLQPYVKEALEEKIGLPVEVKSFKLEFGTVRLTFLIDNQVLVQTDSHYNMPDISFDGIYTISAKAFSYEDVTLGEAELKGDFKGVGKEIDVTGAGKALGANMNYSFTIMNEVAQKIILQMKDVQLAGVLKLLGKPALAQGKIDLEVNMPNIGEETAQGYGHMLLHNASFDQALVKKLYGYALPEKSDINAKAEAKLQGDLVRITGELHSDLFSVLMKGAVFNVTTRQLKGTYDLDVKELRVLTKNKLTGAFNATGNIEAEKGQVRVTGESASFDGVLRFRVAKSVKIALEKLSLEKILPLFKSAVYAKGAVDANIAFTDLKSHEGIFSLKGTNLVTQPDEMKKWMGKALEVKVALESAGRFEKEKIYMTTEMKTPLGNISLKNMEHDKKHKSLKSEYLIDIPELKQLQPYIDKKLYGPMVLNGVFSKEKMLQLTGNTTSLGGKIDYALHGNEFRSTITAVPLLNILGVLGHKKNFLGEAFGKGTYDLKQKSGVVDLDIRAFQIKASSLTNTIKMFLGKDPARIIFSSAKFHADIKEKSTDYTLHATGTRSSIDITEGSVDKINNTNTAKFKFVYENYTVNGMIKGTVDDPKVTIDTSALFKDKIDEKLQNKIEKALGGKAGELLRGLKF